MDTVPHSAYNRNLYTIYALIDPRSNAVCYVGITKDVYTRMRQHSRCEGNNAAKNAWIQELQEEQLMFIMRSLEKVHTVEQALERELYWMNYYLNEGVSLFNIAGVAKPVQVRTTGAISKRKIRQLVREELNKLMETSSQNVRDIPHHIEPWILVDYPIAKRNQKLVTIEEATPEEFQSWLDWNEIDFPMIEDVERMYAWKGLGWTFEYRNYVVNRLLDQGLELKLADGTIASLAQEGA